jgi:hypothetical protein
LLIGQPTSCNVEKDASSSQYSATVTPGTKCKKSLELEHHHQAAEGMANKNLRPTEIEEKSIAELNITTPNHASTTRCIVPTATNRLV